MGTLVLRAFEAVTLDKTPSPQKGSRALRRCYEEHSINNVAYVGETLLEQLASFIFMKNKVANRRLRRYYLIVRLLPDVFALACLSLSSI